MFSSYTDSNNIWFGITDENDVTEILNGLLNRVIGSYTMKKFTSLT